MTDHVTVRGKRGAEVAVSTHDDPLEEFPIQVVAGDGGDMGVCSLDYDGARALIAGLQAALREALSL